MSDYSKAIAYRIDCNETGECYIGSTTQGLANRIAEHRSKNKKFKAGTSKNYCCSFPIIERDNYTYELIEYFPCKNKMELHRKEGEFQRSMECVNKWIAGRTRKEWVKQNPVKIKAYREKYKDTANAQKKIYYKLNKVKILEQQRLKKLEKNQVSQ